MILARQTVYPGVHINFLPQIELGQEVRSYCQVVPREVKHSRQLLIRLPVPNRTIMIFFKVLQTPVTYLPRHFLNHIVLSLAHIDYKTVLRVFLRERLVAVIVFNLFLKLLLRFLNILYYFWW